MADDSLDSKIETEFISNQDPMTIVLLRIDLKTVDTLFNQLGLDNKMSPIVNRQGIKTMENLLRYRDAILLPYRIEYDQRMKTRIEKGEVKKIGEQINDCLKELENIKIEHDHEDFLKKLFEFRGILTKLEVFVFNPKSIYDKAKW